MSHETHIQAQNQEELPEQDIPARLSRRELGKRAAVYGVSIAVGGSGGIGIVEGKRQVESYLDNRAYDTYVNEMEEMLVYIDSVCDFPEENPWIPDTVEESTKMYSTVGFSEYYAEQAGFRLLDTEEALYAIENAQSVGEVIEGFDVLTRQFGAWSTIAANWEFPDFTPGGQAEGQSDLGMLKFRFRKIVDEISHIPFELFKASGISNIHFTEFTSSDDTKTENGHKRVTHGRVWLDGEGRIAISLDRIFEGRANVFTILHEDGHLLDEKISGSRERALNDVHFDSINHPSFDYADIVPDTLKVDGFIRDYSAYNILEDKAVIFENMLSGIDYNLARSQDPIKRKKYRLQLARLERELPNIAPYLSLHGYHGGINPRNPYGAFNGDSTITVA